MALTNNQKRAIHCAARQAGIDPRKQEDTYRLVLWNVGGFRSAADRSARRNGYIAVMAFFEELKFGSAMERLLKALLIAFAIAFAGNDFFRKHNPCLVIGLNDRFDKKRCK